MKIDYYIRLMGLDKVTVARELDISVERLERIMAGKEVPDNLLNRIVAWSKGAVAIADFDGKPPGYDWVHNGQYLSPFDSAEVRGDADEDRRLQEEFYNAR